MKTFILIWDPAISNFKPEDFNQLIPETDWVEMSWSIRDHADAGDGDRVFMVRVGDGNTGIVMSGTIYGKPYVGKDLSGHGHKTYYVKLTPEIMVNSDKCPIITTEQLIREFPAFDWTEGHSGRILPESMEVRLELMWLSYLDANRKIFDGIDASRMDFRFPMEVCDILKQYLDKKKGNRCEICGYDFKKVWGQDCSMSIDWHIFWEPESSEKSRNIIHQLHCVCGNCDMMDTSQLLQRLRKHRNSGN